MIPQRTMVMGVCSYDSVMADANVLEGDVRRFLDEASVPLVAAYLSGAFTGARFETLGGGGDRPGAWDHFGADDLVAVSLLSVDIPGAAALEILETRARLLNSLLVEIPGSAALECSPRTLIDDSSTSARLWSELQDIPGLGWVSVGKLLARKRPALIPVYDNVVKAALQPNRSAFWIPLWSELTDDPAVIDRLAEIRDSVGAPARHLSLIRILDIAIWMRNQGNRLAGIVDVAPVQFERRTDGRWTD